MRDRIARAPALFGFFSFESALAQRASHGHLRTLPAARSALIRLCAAPHARAAVVSTRTVESLQHRLRLHRLAYVGVHGADVHAGSLRLVTEPDREAAEKSVARMKKACSRSPALREPGVQLEDRVWALALHVRAATPEAQAAACDAFAVLAASEGLELRVGQDGPLACPPEASLGRAALGLLAGARRSLPVFVGAGEDDEHGFAAVERLGGLTVHVGEPPPGTHARFHVDGPGEVIRLIHWLADARRR